MKSSSQIVRQASRIKRGDEGEHLHAVSGTDSRVSSALIRQLSGLISVENSEYSMSLKSTRSSGQIRALDWLEMQVDETSSALCSSPRQSSCLPNEEMVLEPPSPMNASISRGDQDFRQSPLAQRKSQENFASISVRPPVSERVS